MDLGLRGKAAAVMAASEGLGHASALALAREGADVAICGRREGVLRKAAEAIADETGRRVVPIVADVSDAHDVERFVNAAALDLRGLHILVTNAGGPPPGRFEQLDDAAWRKGVDLTLLSNVRAIRAALPHFRAEKGGAVVGIASSSVKQPIDNLLISNSIRLAVAGLFKTLANQYAPENIRFNLALPGSMATERQNALAQARAAEANITVEQALAERTRAIPLGRIGEPREFGEAVAFLASERAAYITGAMLQVDGGIIRYPL